MGMGAAVAASLGRPAELLALGRAALLARAAAKRRWDDPNLDFCYGMLNRVSRSFAVVIQQLGTELRDAVCIFYLVLRALDTVEDDMSIPKDVKVPALQTFYTHLEDPTWTIRCGTGAYADLMEKYSLVTKSYLKLSPKFQEVIKDITKRMGAGMAEFIGREASMCKQPQHQQDFILTPFASQVITKEDYDLYCHYVAGLVGIGLSNLFVNAGLEEPYFASADDLSNSLGLFLQKTNIIRDYHEDITELPAPRMFWPKEVWGKYATHLEIMAMGTLTVCYNNVDVFRKNVKMRRGASARIVVNTTSMLAVYTSLVEFASELRAKVKANLDDPSVKETEEAVKKLLLQCEKGRQKALQKQEAADLAASSLSFRLVVLLAFLAYAAYAFGFGGSEQRAEALKPFGLIQQASKSALCGWRLCCAYT
eukprot:jgi/Chlat1/3487/Chrsp23S00264